MIDVFVVSGLSLIRALKKHNLRPGVDYTSEKGAASRNNQVLLRFKDKDKALLFKLTYGAGEH